MDLNDIEKLEPEIALKQLQSYLDMLIAKKDEAIKEGNFEQAASIRDKEKIVLEKIKLYQAHIE